LGSTSDGIQSTIYDSDGKGGIHLWVNFSEPIPAKEAYHFIRWAARDFKEHLKQCECFPKQPTVQNTDARCGNNLRLEGKHHKRDHWSRALCEETNKWLTAEETIRVILSTPVNDPAVLDVVPEPESLKTKQPKKKAPVKESSAHDQQVSDGSFGITPLEKIQSALRFVPSDDYNTWIKVGMMLRSERPDLFTVWRDWSATSTKHRPGDCKDKWPTFATATTNGLTIGSLWYLAKQHGWVDSWTSSGAGKHDEIAVPLSTLKALAEEEERAVHLTNAHCPLPDAVFKDAPGFIGDYFRLLMDNAAVQMPESFLSAAISVLSASTRGYSMPFNGFDTRTNLYSVLLATSGEGKDFARKANQKLIHRAESQTMDGAPKNVETILGATDYTSASAVLRDLERSSACLLQLDEFAQFLGGVNDVNSCQKGISKILLELFTSSDNQIWKPRAFADQKKNISLSYPHAVIYGTATPDRFWDNLLESQITDGLLGRILIFEDKAVKPSIDTSEPNLDDDGCVIPKGATFNEDAIPDSIVDTLLYWDSSRQRQDADMVIRMKPDAHQRLRSHHEQIRIKAYDETEHAPIKAALWKRTQEKSSKLAMLAAMARKSNIVEIEDVEWAILLCNALTRRVITRTANVAATPYQYELNKVLEILHRHKALPASKLTKKAYRVPRYQRDPMIKDLLESDQIVRVFLQTKRRSATWYGLSYGHILTEVNKNLAS